MINYSFCLFREVEECVRVFAAFISCFQILLVIKSSTNPGDLFLNKIDKIVSVEQCATKINVSSFFGRFLAFQVSWSFYCVYVLPFLRIACEEAKKCISSQFMRPLGDSCCFCYFYPELVRPVLSFCSLVRGWSAISPHWQNLLSMRHKNSLRR